MTDAGTREERANVRDDRANNRDDRASVRDGRADDRDKLQRDSLKWLFAVLVIIGIALTIALVSFNRTANRLDNKVDKLGPGVEMNDYNLRLGRYERLVFQRDERLLTCIDLQDGDTGATDVQYKECAKDYIKVPPKPVRPVAK